MDDHDAGGEGTNRQTHTGVDDGRAERGVTEEGVRPVEAEAIPEPEAAALRTGAEQPWDPEDVAIAEGRDPTPENVERARRELDEYGQAIIERIVP